MGTATGLFSDPFWVGFLAERLLKEKKEKLAAIGEISAAVRLGREKFIKKFPKYAPDEGLDFFKEMTEEAMTRMRLEELFKNEIFFLSLRLALCEEIAGAKISENFEDACELPEILEYVQDAMQIEVLRKEDSPEPTWKDGFKNRLAEIFGADEKFFFTAAVETARAERRKNHYILPLFPRIRYCDYAIQKMMQGEEPLEESQPTPFIELERASGNKSQMVACPSCKTPKRVFPDQTKNFRCECGFKSAWPFEKK